MTLELSPQQIEVTERGFSLGAQPFQMRSGELHFARVPRPYWRHRLEMARAMGLNTVCAYLFWNLHEPRPGKFYFQDQADVRAFVELAHEVGLKVVLRPGPYACAEWDFGGLPAWLLAESDVRLRCSDAKFVAAARRYLLRVGDELADLQVSEDGPILLVQVENEYGSYGDDKNYLAAVRDALRDAGFTVPFFTCDGPDALERGSIEGAFVAANFNDGPAESFEKLKQFDARLPRVCGEYYPGWFDHWGAAHRTRSTASIVPEVELMLREAAGFSIYMFHGGTSFGFGAGANADLNGNFLPQTTSYDYDAPLNEAGQPTPKFHALRELFREQESQMPPIPASQPTISIPPIEFSESAPLLDHLPAPIFDVLPRPMECYGQSNGLILYRSTLPAGPETPLTIRELHDYGLVFVDGERLATLDRRLGQNRVSVPAREETARLEILVEGMGRVNYGPFMVDRKGITERVEFPFPYPAGVIMNWEIHLLPLGAAEVANLPFSTDSNSGPAFQRANFELETVGDTFLDMRGWNKGYVWVNGHNLGRFWHIGPQQTLYLPGCWLREGENEIIVFDFDSRPHRTVQGLSEPILNEIG